MRRRPGRGIVSMNVAPPSGSPSVYCNDGEIHNLEPVLLAVTGERVGYVCSRCLAEGAPFILPDGTVVAPPPPPRPDFDLIRWVIR